MYVTAKKIIDRILALLGMIVLSPVFLILVAAIKLDSRGPVLFRQKRVGIHKTHFHILKFRTMRIDTPKDMPTHLLENPEQYITKVGRFLRKSSLDELPIPVKAKLDGEYVEKMGFAMDIRCLVRTVASVVRQDGVVEGGTGTLEEKKH